jgi:probable O-glycosylation ligase (exosortase A-associated)
MKGLLFTYLMTYGGALVALFNPFYGLLIYVCLGIIKPEAMWYWSVPEGNYSRIVALGLLVGWAVGGFGRWRFGRARGVVLAFLAFWVWSGLAAARAPQQDLAWAFVEELTKVVLPFLVGITTIDSVRKLKLLAWVIVLSHGYVAFELNLSYLQGFNRVTELGASGMDNNCVAVAMDTCVGLAFFLGLHADGWWRKALALGAALLMAHVVLLAFSRGGMLGLLVTGLVTFVLIRKRPAHYALATIALLVVLRLAGPQVRDRFMTSFREEGERDSSAEGRLELWSNCLDIMAKNPVLGIGPRHFRLVAPQYGWPQGKEAHTLWLQAGAELGVPALLFLVLFYALCVTRLRPFLRGPGDVPDPWLQYLACMVVASLLGFGVSAQFVSMVGLEVPYYVTLIGAGVLKVADDWTTEPGYVSDDAHWDGRCVPQPVPLDG